MLSCLVFGVLTFDTYFYKNPKILTSASEPIDVDALGLPGTTFSLTEDNSISVDVDDGHVSFASSCS